MTSPAPSGPPLLGPLLAHLRLARGWSQSRLAAELCAASGVPTLSRHEVSRWERHLRVPGGFWLGWLAVVLAVPLDTLVEAAVRTRRLDGDADERAARRFRAAVAGAGPYPPRAPSGPGRPSGRRGPGDRTARPAPGRTPGTAGTR
ncbi:helix-turn-helix domain-containing protein [Micromonospora sp. BQ11]|uniref:helix-turn-helix domain-containing protein n=1 Tax=Micromonospora sp. BQ11 TaxID=3452212 RepID=UPI003F8A05D8